jgi:cell division septation protein DedD
MIEFLAAMRDVWTFLKSPIGVKILISIGVVIVILGWGAHERHDQFKKDAPLITNPATHRQWKLEAAEAAANLVQCRVNYGVLKSAKDQQNAELTAKSRLDIAKLAVAEAALKAARGQVTQLQARSAATLAYRPTGATACLRLQDTLDHYRKGLK